VIAMTEAQHIADLRWCLTNIKTRVTSIDSFLRNGIDLNPDMVPNLVEDVKEFSRRVRNGPPKSRALMPGRERSRT
jgi:hypothetical protein